MLPKLHCNIDVGKLRKNNKAAKLMNMLIAYYICSPECPGGETGRRTVFRSQREQSCAGSNPVLGTELQSSEFSELFYFALLFNLRDISTNYYYLPAFQ
jgi:hypothetical protein